MSRSKQAIWDRGYLHANRLLLKGQKATAVHEVATARLMSNYNDYHYGMLKALADYEYKLVCKLRTDRRLKCPKIKVVKTRK